MNLLLLEPGERFLPRADERARHIRKILRLRIGDRLRAGEIDGSIGSARIVAADASGYSLEYEPMGEPPALAPVTLLLGHPRPIVLRRLLRDLASIGPARIIVTHTELGEKSYYEANLWNDVRTPLVEGAAQGGSTRLPVVERHRSLAAAIATLAPPPAGDALPSRFVLHAESDDTAAAPDRDPGDRDGGVELLPDAMAGSPPNDGLVVAVGSERGWTPDEVDLFGAAGFERRSLGGRVLRSEIAAIVAVWSAVAWYYRRP